MRANEPPTEPGKAEPEPSSTQCSSRESGGALEQRSDAELMVQIAAGNEQAFEQLYDRHSARLYGLCLRILGKTTDAQSVLSDVFYEIWQSAGRFDPARGSVRTYLTTLARSRAIDRLRSEATRSAHEKQFHAESAPPEPPVTRGLDPAASMISQETFEQVRRALDELTEPQRKSLEMSYFGGLTHREIADRLQLPLGTVKTHIRIALEKLRREIAPVENEDTLK